jgi:hypothetical protein
MRMPATMANNENRLITSTTYITKSRTADDLTGALRRAAAADGPVGRPLV